MEKDKCVGLAHTERRANIGEAIQENLPEILTRLVLKINDLQQQVIKQERRLPVTFT